MIMESVEIATSSSLAVFGRHIRLVCLDLMWRFLLSPKSGAFRGPHMELRNDNVLGLVLSLLLEAMLTTSRMDCIVGLHATFVAEYHVIVGTSIARPQNDGRFCYRKPQIVSASLSQTDDRWSSLRQGTFASRLNDCL